MKRMAIFALLLLLAVFFAGCTVNETPIASPSPSGALNTGMVTLAPTTGVSPGADTLGTPPPATGTVSLQDSAALARQIEAEVTKLSEVTSAHAVVMGDSVLVGVQFDAQYKGELTNRIKDMVAERVKVVQPGIKQVAVTADADLLARINAIGTKVADNAPVGDITSEFTEVFNRILPTT